MGNSHQFFVIGTPGPQGSKRHVGNGRMIEVSKRVAPWRISIAWTVRDLKLKQLSGPLGITIEFFLHRPKSLPKKRFWPTSRNNDLDKLLRSTFDGLCESGLFIDDSQIVEIIAQKKYATAETGASIHIREIEGEHNGEKVIK